MSRSTASALAAPSAEPVGDEDASGEPELVSVVIPVYNSATIVAGTVEHTRQVLRDHDIPYEVILVDDGSADDSWRVIKDLAERLPDVAAIRLLRNYGQHNANLAGFRASRGTWVVTMDDDGQNPPEEIPRFLAAAHRGDHDLVFGRFNRKAAPRFRSMGSHLIAMMNRRIFGQPDHLTVSNHRLLHREVVDRICDDATRYPYITGQALLYSGSPGNLDVEHLPRADGTSNYNLRRILTLVLRILFSYSLAPLHIAAVAGGVIAAASFAGGAIFLLRGIITRAAVPGWTTLVVLLAFFQGVTLIILAMLGEYVVRTLNQVSDRPTYHVARTVDGR